MSTPILIGLNGYKGSGKDTAAQFIIKWADNRSRTAATQAFADLAVLSMMRALGLATNLNDARVIYNSFKETGGMYVEVPDQAIGVEISGRQFAKWYATEGHRDVFGEDFWVDKVLPISGDDFHWSYNFLNPNEPDIAAVADIAIVTDVRFANEARRVRRCGGQVWNIDRGLDADDHPLEQPLPVELVDVVIDNRTTLERFEVNVNSQMTADYHMKFVERPDPLSF